eukprot:6393187-Amphidinium_carterae.1
MTVSGAYHVVRLTSKLSNQKQLENRIDPKRIPSVAYTSKRSKRSKPCQIYITNFLNGIPNILLIPSMAR